MLKSPDIFTIIDFYIDELFAPEDEALKRAIDGARKHDLPQIQVSPGQGKLLYLLAKMIGARRILEVGTLGGYSAIWLARALPDGGKLITLEANENYARVAGDSIARAGLKDRVEVVVGDATRTLASITAVAPEPFDMVFLDADKINYPHYLQLVMSCVRSGSVILADNVIRAGTVLAPSPDDHAAAAARAFNRMIAEDDRLEALVLQQVGVKGHDGLAIARVR